MCPDPDHIYYLDPNQEYEFNVSGSTTLHMARWESAPGLETPHHVMRSILRHGLMMVNKGRGILRHGLMMVNKGRSISLDTDS